MFVPISFFTLVFLRKAIMGRKLLTISLKLLSMLNMRQCLFVISFIFGSTWLYVNENDIVSLLLGLQCFKRIWVVFFMYLGWNVKLWGFWIDQFQPISQCFRKYVLFFQPAHCVVNQFTVL